MQIIKYQQMRIWSTNHSLNAALLVKIVGCKPNGESANEQKTVIRQVIFFQDFWFIGHSDSPHPDVNSLLSIIFPSTRFAQSGAAFESHRYISSYEDMFLKTPKFNERDWALLT
jgi:hypothetical protein